MTEQVNKLAHFYFYMGTQRNDTKSQQAGRPIFDDVEMVHVRWAGDTKKDWHVPASDRSDRWIIDPATNDKYWPKWKDHPDLREAYEAFKKGIDASTGGTPLDEMTSLPASKRAELKAINIFTVDQLANLGPDGMKRLGVEGPKLKEQAKLYLDRAAGAAVDARHAEERDAMQRQIDELKAMIQGGGEASVSVTRAKAKPVPVAEADLSSSPFFAMDDESILLWCREADPQGTLPKRHHKASDATWHAQIVQHAEELNARIKAERSKAA